MNTPTTTDERRGATSASSAHADSLCPGRHLAQRGLPEQTSADAEFGRKVHEALSKTHQDVGGRSIMDDMSTAEREVFDACRELEKKLVGEFAQGENVKIIREQRFWCMVDRKFEHSARPDLVVKAKDKGLIIEYKTLPGEVQDAAQNMQLRDQAVLVRVPLLLTSVAVAVVQPLTTMSPQVCLYSLTDLKMAEQEMFARVRRSNDPVSPRVPGAVQCCYCRAKGVCVEYKSWANALVPSQEPLPKALIEVPVGQWSVDQRKTFCDALEALGEAFAWVESCKKAMKEALKADPAAIPGWCLKPGAVVESVKDPQGLFTRFIEAGGNQEAFLSAITVKKGEFSEAVKVVTKLRGKKLTEEVKRMLDGLTESRQNEPSLARAQEAK